MEQHGLMLQVLSSVMIRGILHRECTLHPPVSTVTQIPELPRVSAICPLDLTEASSAFSRNVLPVLPGTSRSKTVLLMLLTDSMMASKTVGWPVLKLERGWQLQ